MAMKRYELLKTLLVVAIALFVVLNSTIFFVRADITRTKIYTFSATTRNLFQSIPQQVQISYWVSDRLRKISPIPGEIEDILKEYASASRGKITLRIVNPDKQSGQANPQALGIYPEQMNIMGQSSQTTANVYSGIAVQYLDRHVAIPFVATTQNLEYSLTSKLEELLHPGEWNVDVLIGNSKRTLSGDYTLVGDGLGRYYNVKEIKPGNAIDASARALIVLGGVDLTAADLAPINQYIMQGGNVLICIPGVDVDTLNNLKAKLYGKLPIFDLVSNYGVKIDPELVLDSHNKDFRTLRQSGGQYVWQDYGPYPHWVSILPQDVSSTNPITRHFSALDLLWPSPLTVRNLPDVNTEALVKSSSNAWTMSTHFNTSPVDIPAFSKPADPALTGQYTLAATLTGRFPDFYSSKKSAPARMVVVGDDNFLSNLVHYSNSSYNVSFLQNAVDWLTGHENLLAIKTKAQWDPRLDKIADPAAKLRVYQFAEFVNVGLIPVIVILFGLRRYSVRRKGRGPQRERS